MEYIEISAYPIWIIENCILLNYSVAQKNAVETKLKTNRRLHFES